MKVHSGIRLIGYLALSLLFGMVLGSCAREVETPTEPPNIVFIIADDASWAHFGAYGDKVARTPNFDRIAREGAIFENAFCSSPSCTPSRGAILTGQQFWRLGEGGNLWAYWPNKEPVYPDLLADAGYKIGLKGKGWSPGEPTRHGRLNNPAGPNEKDFAEFVRKANREPFCFWFGSMNPHRPYEKGSGARKGLKAEDVVVPPWMPDTPEVRSDLLDYYGEIEAFDDEIGKILETLETEGLLDKTIVVVTSDNGFPFPRGKTHLYDYGARMPLAIRWPSRIAPGQRINDFVSHTDLAPTFLEAANLERPPAMTGSSLWPLLSPSGLRWTRERREEAFFGRERHAFAREGDIGYPMRAIRTNDFLYIRNFEPNRWPAGDPPMYGDLDQHNAIEEGSAKEAVILGAESSEAGKQHYALSLGKRQPEELYDLRSDPYQTMNIANDPHYHSHKSELRNRLNEYMAQTNDPRARGLGYLFDRYERYGPDKQK